MFIKLLNRIVDMGLIIAMLHFYRLNMMDIVNNHYIEFFTLMTAVIFTWFNFTRNSIVLDLKSKYFNKENIEVK